MATKYLSIIFVIVCSIDTCRSLVASARSLQSQASATNRFLRLDSTVTNDDHTPDQENPKVPAVIDNEDGTIFDPNNDWQDDDDDKQTTCSRTQIDEEEDHRMLCLNVLTNLYDLAKGYDESDDDDVIAADTNRSTIAHGDDRRFRRQAVRDVIISTTELNFSAGRRDGPMAKKSELPAGTDNNDDKTTEQDDDDEDMSPYLLVASGATRPPTKKRESKASPAFTKATTDQTSTRAPFAGSNSEVESRDDVSAFQLTQADSNASTVAVDAATTVAIATTSVGALTALSGKPEDQVATKTVPTDRITDMTTRKSAEGQQRASTAEAGSREEGVWITAWKQTVTNVLPGFLPDEKFTPKQELFRNNVCTRLVTLPFVHDRCCVTLSIVCADLMTSPDGDEEPVKVKHVTNSQNLPNQNNANTDGDTWTVDNNNQGVENNNNNNNNNNNSGGPNSLKTNLKKLMGDAIQSLASLVADMVRNSSK